MRERKINKGGKKLEKSVEHKENTAVTKKIVNCRLFILINVQNYSIIFYITKQKIILTPFFNFGMTTLNLDPIQFKTNHFFVRAST